MYARIVQHRWHYVSATNVTHTLCNMVSVLMNMDNVHADDAQCTGVFVFPAGETPLAKTFVTLSTCSEVQT